MDITEALHIGAGLGFLEQLRALSNGVKVQVALCEQAIPPGVDTEHDLEAVRSLLAEA